MQSKTNCMFQFQWMNCTEGKGKLGYLRRKKEKQTPNRRLGKREGVLWHHAIPLPPSILRVSVGVTENGSREAGPEQNGICSSCFWVCVVWCVVSVWWATTECGWVLLRMVSWVNCSVKYAQDSDQNWCISTAGWDNTMDKQHRAIRTEYLCKSK